MERPNIIIIYADDLGFGDLGCYGGTGVPTPNLDRMAFEGLKFTNSYATASTCTPSRYSLLTGSYPWRNSEAQILRGDAPLIINPSQPNLPSTLRDCGYRTGIVGKWHLGLGHGSLNWNDQIEGCPLDIGFDSSYIMAATNDRVPCVYLKGRRVEGLDSSDPLEVDYGSKNPFPGVPTAKDRPDLLRMAHSDQQHDDTIVNGVGRIGFCRGGKAAEWKDESMAEQFLSEAVKFMEEEKGKPFFLYYALHQPHVPRLPGPRFAGTTALGPRGDAIAELDWCVGQILDYLETNGLSEKTMVIFSSDNGPVLDDGYCDGAISKCGSHRPAGPLRGGKYSLFDGGARVPMLVQWQGTISGGNTSAALFSQVDFFASLASLTASPVAATTYTFDSEDHSAALIGEDAIGRDHLVTEGIGGKTVIRQKNWVYIPAYNGPVAFTEKAIETGYHATPQLFDLNEDIGQCTNRIATHPEIASSLAQLLKRLHWAPIHSNKIPLKNDRKLQPCNNK